MRPEIFTIENVPRAAKTQRWQVAKSRLRLAGYHVEETVIDAAKMGVPQRRRASGRSMWPSERARRRARLRTQEGGGREGGG